MLTFIFFYWTVVLTFCPKVNKDLLKLHKLWGFRLGKNTYWTSANHTIWMDMPHSCIIFILWLCFYLLLRPAKLQYYCFIKSGTTLWHSSETNQMARQQWVCSTANIKKVTISCNCTPVLNIILHHQQYCVVMNIITYNHNINLEIFNVCVCMWVTDWLTDWLSDIMQGGPPSPCVPPPSGKSLNPGAVIQPPPQICGIAGGSEEGRVNIHVTLMDMGPTPGVECVWFCFLYGWMNK